MVKRVMEIDEKVLKEGDKAADKAVDEAIKAAEEKKPDSTLFGVSKGLVRPGPRQKTEK